MPSIPNSYVHTQLTLHTQLTHTYPAYPTHTNIPNSHVHTQLTRTYPAYPTHTYTPNSYVHTQLIRTYPTHKYIPNSPNSHVHTQLTRTYPAFPTHTYTPNSYVHTQLTRTYPTHTLNIFYFQRMTLYKYIHWSIYTYIMEKGLDLKFFNVIGGPSLALVFTC